MPFSLPLPRGYKYECLNGNTLNKHINICVCVLVYPYLDVFGYVTVPTIHLRPTPCTVRVRLCMKSVILVYLHQFF